MKYCCPYVNVELQIDSLQNWIVVQSIIYYELNDSIVTDSVFDNNCKELVKLIRDNIEEHKKSDLYYIFKDFDGSTGFDLYHNMCEGDKDRFMKKALNALRVCKKGKV